MHLTANDQHIAVHASTHELISYREGIDEARTLIAHIEGAATAIGNAKLALHEDSAPWEIVIGRKRRKYDEVDICRLNAGRRTCASCSFCSHRGGRLLRFGSVAPLFDPSTFTNPLIGRIHDLREVIVGNNAVGHVVSHTCNSTVGHRSVVRLGGK